MRVGGPCLVWRERVSMGKTLQPSAETFAPPRCMSPSDTQDPNEVLQPVHHHTLGPGKQPDAAFSGRRWRGGVPDCSGCCSPTVPSRGWSNHHSPRWRSHYRSDFVYFASWVDVGCSPRRGVRPAVAQRHCRGPGGTEASAASYRREAMAVRSSGDRDTHSAARGVRSFGDRDTHSVARGVPSALRELTGCKGCQATGSCVEVRCRSCPWAEAPPDCTGARPGGQL